MLYFILIPITLFRGLLSFHHVYEKYFLVLNLLLILWKRKKAQERDMLGKYTDKSKQVAWEAAALWMIKETIIIKLVMFGYFFICISEIFFLIFKFKEVKIFTYILKILKRILRIQWVIFFCLFLYMVLVSNFKNKKYKTYSKFILNFQLNILCHLER